MKKLLTLLAVAFAFGCEGQIDTITVFNVKIGYSKGFDSTKPVPNVYIGDSTMRFGSTISSKWCMSVFGQSGSEYIMYCNDSTIEIYGDTVKAIKNAMGYFNWYQERYWESRAVLDRINLNNLQKLVFKNDKQFINAVKKYLKNRDKNYKPQ